MKHAVKSSKSPVPAAERMRRYRARRRATGLRLDRRWVPDESVAKVPFSDHRLLELRSLALHAAVARKLRANPSLLDRARATLSRWLATVDVRGRPALEEWREILDRPLADVLSTMTDWTEHAIQLRQSSPFVPILTSSQRRAIYEAFRP